MKKMILMMFLGILGILNIQAQTGTVERTFYMNKIDGTLDTCHLSMSFKEGIVTYLGMSFNHKEKGTYLVAFIEGNPNMYHKYKTVEDRIKDFQNLLDTIQGKYKIWSKVAASNKIGKFKKKIGDFKNVPILALNAYNKGTHYFPKTEVPYIDESTPYFEVKENGTCQVFFGWNGFKFERTKGYNAGFWTSYPIKEEINVYDIIFIFSSPLQLQGLIDALNLETAKQELLTNTEENKNMDSLFK